MFKNKVNRALFGFGKEKRTRSETSTHYGEKNAHLQIVAYCS